MPLQPVEIGLVASSLGIIWVLIQIFIASRRRDKELQKNASEEAVWRTKVEMKFDQLEHDFKTLKADFPTTQSIIGIIDNLRKENKEEHERLTHHIDEQLRRLDDKVERVAKEGRESRGEIYTLIEKIRK